jgi:glutaminyl-tRNA synthetase
LLLLIILWKEEQLDAENNQEDEAAGFRKVPFKRALYRKGRFSEVAPPKFFRLSIGNEVRLKMDILLRRISYKDSDGTITEIQVTYEDSHGGSGSEASA